MNETPNPYLLAQELAFSIIKTNEIHETPVTPALVERALSYAGFDQSLIQSSLWRLMETHIELGPNWILKTKPFIGVQSAEIARRHRKLDEQDLEEAGETINPWFIPQDQISRQRLGLPPVPGESPSAITLEHIVNEEVPVSRIMQEHRRRVSPGKSKTKRIT